MPKDEQSAQAQYYTFLPRTAFEIKQKNGGQKENAGNFHAHDGYELYYETEGTRLFYVEEHSYFVNAGNLVLVGANQPHKSESFGENAAGCIVANFSHEYLAGIGELFPKVDFFSFLHDEKNHLLSTATVKEQAKIHETLQELMYLQTESGGEAEALCRLRLAALLIQLNRLCRRQNSRCGTESGQPARHIVEQVQEYIAEHYPERITLTGIAGSFYISPYYLSRLMKKI